jgi:hypothetical protein
LGDDFGWQTRLTQAAETGLLAPQNDSGTGSVASLAKRFYFWF